MSCYGWEAGEFILPSAAVSSTKKALRDLHNTLHAAARTKAIALHRQLKSRSQARYLSNVREFERKRHELPTSRDQYGRTIPHDDVALTLALEILDRKLRSNDPSVQLRQPTMADVNAVIPAATNKTTSFPIYTNDGYAEGIISFNGRTVRYSVDENNHSVDRANESLIVRAFDNAMDRINWTRGTGGYTVGNDEYNQESEGIGGGGNYLCRTYGPLGQRRY